MWWTVRVLGESERVSLWEASWRAEMIVCVLFLSVDTTCDFRSLLVDAVRHFVCTYSIISHQRQELFSMRSWGDTLQPVFTTVCENWVRWVGHSKNAWSERKVEFSLSWVAICRLFTDLREKVSRTLRRCSPSGQCRAKSVSPVLTGFPEEQRSTKDK